MGVYTYENKMRLIQNLNLTSDVFIGKVMEDTAVLEEFLYLVTGEEFQIGEVRTQYVIRNLVTHSVQLDVYAQDCDGELIHIEIQNRDDDNHVLRTRFNRSCIDVSLLDKGVKYNELPDLIQLFVTKNDFLGLGKAVVYNKKMISDGTTEIYFNLSIKSERESLAALQKYFIETTEENESDCFSNLVNRVRFLKYGKGESIMCEVFDKVREWGREEGREEAHKEMIFCMLSHNQSPERISEITEKPLKYIYEVQKEYEKMR